MPYPDFTPDEIERYRDLYPELEFYSNADVAELMIAREEEKRDKELEERRKQEAAIAKAKAEAERLATLSEEDRQLEKHLLAIKVIFKSRNDQERLKLLQKLSLAQEPDGVDASDSRVRHILSRLNECNRPVPRELPAIPENPDPQKFTKLVYIDTKVPLQKLVSAIKVNRKKLTNYLDLSQITNVVETPKKPYFVWMQDGNLYKGKSINQAQKMFSQNERGATVREGLFLILYYPEILKNHYIDLPGSRCDSDRVPYLRDWGDDPGLAAGDADRAHSLSGSVSVGVSLNP